MTKINNSTISLIQRTAEKLADYYVCPGYDKEDIIQEAVMYGLSKIKDYDESRARGEKGLENFMFVVMTSRLTNLKQQKWFDHKKDFEGSVNQSKKRIMRPLQLSENNSYEHDGFDRVDDGEILDLIMEYMPAQYRLDYEKILEGVPVQSVRREKIITVAREIHDLIMDDNVAELKKRRAQETLCQK